MEVAELLDPSDRRWSQFLSTVAHDIYHHPEYLTTSAEHEGGRPVAFLYENGHRRLLLPLLIRVLPVALQNGVYRADAASPYGYPGPLWTGDPDPVELDHIMRKFVALCRAEFLLTVFLRLHPLFTAPPGLLQSCAALVNHGETVWVDLTRSEEELWRDTRPRYRENIRALRRKGFQFVVDDWSLLPAFVHAYHQTMTHVSAPDFYFFQPRYFCSLRERLGRFLHLAAVISPEGKLAAGGLFASTSDIVQYHLGGVADVYRPEAPMKLLLHGIRDWSKREGFRILHLGGGRGCRQDSLLWFKAGFSPLRAPFATARFVLDHARYHQLTKCTRAQICPGESESEFFPQYRHPRLQVAGNE